MDAEVIELSSETSDAEEDGKAKEVKSPRLSKTRPSLNLYELGICGVKSESGKDAQIISEYDTLLKREIDQWVGLLKNTKEQIKKNENATLHFTDEILTEHHIQHINQRPNFKNFLEDFEKFSKKCHNFFEMYEANLDEQQKLISAYIDVVNKCNLKFCKWEL